MYRNTDGQEIGDAEIEVAVEWWAEDVAKYASRDNGDVSLASAFITALEAPRREQAVPSAEQVEKFKDALRQSLKEWMDGADYRRSYISLGVDYGPDSILSEAAEKAGIDRNRFSWKTNMWIYPGQVKAARGYGQDNKVIFPLPGDGHEHRFFCIDCEAPHVHD